MSLFDIRTISGTKTGSGTMSAAARSEAASTPPAASYDTAMEVADPIHMVEGGRDGRDSTQVDAQDCGLSGNAGRAAGEK